jgi:3alpha(or 20beta)-hydroxysteroid dehydrogenase
VALDVGDEAQWAEAVAAAERVGPLNGLVNNAGVFKPLPMAQTDAALFDLHVRVNQLGTYLGMRAVVPAFERSGGGAIVNISSVAGLRGTPNAVAYTATKWAVRGMTRSAALELARYHIRVNAIFPGVIDTPMNDGNPAAMNEVLVRSTPMRRMGEPDEIAQAVLFLASPSSSFATGAELAIDGGMSI